MVEQVFRGASEQAMHSCGCAVRRVDSGCWFMLGRVSLRVICHTGSADECKMRHICVLNTALDLAATALCIEWGMGGN